MTKGFTILALGAKEYGFWARNMAASLKYFNPECKVQLIHDGQATKDIPLPDHYGNIPMYDEITIMPESLYLDNGRFSPGKAKIHLYDLFAFDHTIYLDVDGCAVREVDELFDICEPKPVVSQVWDYGKLEDKTFGDLMYWADAAPIWNHYKLPSDARLPFLNTSFMSVVRGRESEAIYRKAQACIANPMPLSAMRELWGKGNQPDELYTNVAMAMLDYEPHVEGFTPVYFRTRTFQGDQLNLADVQSKHWFLGLWGGARMNHHSILTYYDGIMRKVWAKVGQTHVHKTQNLMKRKFVQTN